MWYDAVWHVICYALWCGVCAVVCGMRTITAKESSVMLPHAGVLREFDRYLSRDDDGSATQRREAVDHMGILLVQRVMENKNLPRLYWRSTPNADGAYCDPDLIGITAADFRKTLQKGD